MIITSDNTKAVLRNKKGSDSTHSLTHIPEEIALTASSSYQDQSGDCIFNIITPSTSYTGGRIVAENIIGSVRIQPLTENIATIDEHGYLSRMSSGVAKFKCTFEGVSKGISVDMTTKNNGDVARELVSVVEGTLAEHLSEQIDSMLNPSMTMETNGKIFSTQNHTAEVYVRNPNFWGKTVDFTCCSPWNSTGSKTRAGTLVTPRHIIFAAHYQINTGARIRFVDNDNNVITRTMIAKKTHPNYVLYNPDFVIGLLDSDVPSAISPCKAFSSSCQTYLNLSNLAYSRPAAVGLDQEEKGLIIDLASKSSFRSSSDSTRNIFNENKISGDSGNPAFVIVNGELVLITVWTYGGAGSGTAICDYIDDLNQMIIDVDTIGGVSTGYTLTEVDLSSFPTIT